MGLLPLFTQALWNIVVEANLTPTPQDWKGDSSRSLSGIKQAPDELFQEFMDSLLKAASRIFGDPQAGVPFKAFICLFVCLFVVVTLAFPLGTWELLLGQNSIIRALSGCCAKQISNIRFKKA